MPSKLSYSWACIAIVLVSIFLPGRVNASEPPAQKVFTVSSEARLHEWLIANQAALGDDFRMSLAWLSEQQAREDAKLRTKLRSELLDRSLAAARDPLGAVRLLRLIDALPYLGRVRLPSADLHWLEVNPSANPVLSTGDRIVSFQRPSTVTVVLESGRICRVLHVSGQPADAYADTCKDDFKLHSGLRDILRAKGTLWVAQPDGLVLPSPQDLDMKRSRVLPAPGAWIWVPTSDFYSREGFSREFAGLLAGQGPAGPYMRPLMDEELTVRRVLLRPPLALRSNWGSIGLVQMPTARMAPEGSLAVTRSVADPYRRLSVFVSPFSWMEIGVRYTDIRNKSYWDDGRSKTYTDKSIDLKFRVFEESRFLPEVGLGLVDAGGTGLFSSEYLVASKQWRDLDFSAGLAFGYLGAGGSMSNPLGAVAGRFDNRQSYDRALGGQPGVKTWFTGPASPFFGVQWRTPWEDWILKAEYSSNNHSLEPYLDADFYTVRPASSRINVGAVYQWTDWVDVSVGLERGNQVTAAITLYSDLNRKQTPKLLSPALPSLAPQAMRPLHFQSTSGWASLRSEVESQTDWRIEAIETLGDSLFVRFYETPGLYAADRVEIVGRLLHQHAPPNVSRFVLEMQSSGLATNTIEIDRTAFISERTVLQPPVVAAARPAVVERTPAAPEPDRQVLFQGLKPRKSGEWQSGAWSGGLGVSYDQLLGGPTGFWLYELGARAQAEWRPRANFWIQGTAKYRAIDNYEKYPDQTPSLLPPVRTDFKAYRTGERLTLPNLQATHVGQPFGASSSHHYAVYAGYLEYMYGGYGAEYLYRPWRSNLALGVDWNQVRKRDFDQRFDFRDLRSNTGHLTAYWDTGFKDVLMVVKAGRYMAGDRGWTLQLSRVFQSGLVFGGFFTRTNVSAEQFGEGSFDKVMYVQIPFDLVLPARSSSSATFGWRNLTRDGGVMLERANALYDMTSMRDRRAMVFGTQ